MDVEEKPTFNVLDGIRLAHQFYAKRDIYKKQEPCFSSLPDEIQGRITAQAHPRQTVDAYFSDDLICVGEKKLPHKIYNFAVQDDSLAYASELSDSEYSLKHMSLETFLHSAVVYELSNANAKILPLALCGGNILYQSVFIGTNNQVFILNKNFLTSWRLFNVAGAPISCLAFACHAHLPLCVSIGEDRVLRVHNVETQELMYERDVRNFFGNSHDDLYAIALHPTKPICAVSKNDWIFVHGLNSLRCDAENHFGGKPCFSYDGNKIWGQSNSKLKWVGSTYEYLSKSRAGIDKKDITVNNAAIESFGDDYVLIRDNATHVFSLQSLHDDTNKVITSLSGFNGKLHKLPDNHDYRLFIIDEVIDPKDTSSVQSIIKIFVPNSRARMEHYCLFNAALEAEKTNRAIDWNLFKKADQQLVQQTVLHYPYFKKLMLKNKLL